MRQGRRIVTAMRTRFGTAPPTLDPDMSVDEIMRRWPAAVAVVMRHGMFCIGCPIGTFHTVTEACAEHGVCEQAFVEELMAAIAQ